MSQVFHEYSQCFFIFDDFIVTSPTNSQTSCYPGTDYPFLKTDNREIAQILHNLRRMERKLDGELSPVPLASIAAEKGRRSRQQIWENVKERGKGLGECVGLVK